MAGRVLWSTTSLFIAVSAAIAVPTAFLSGPAWALQVAYVLLFAAAASLLTLMFATIARREAFDDSPDFDTLPPVVAWPLRVGWWIGAVAIGLIQGVMVLTTPGGGEVIPSTRFAMSLMATIGIVVLLFTAPATGDVALLTLLYLWCAVIVLAIVRGLVTLVTRVIHAVKAR